MMQCKQQLQLPIISPTLLRCLPASLHHLIVLHAHDTIRQIPISGETDRKGCASADAAFIHQNHLGYLFCRSHLLFSVEEDHVVGARGEKEGKGVSSSKGLLKEGKASKMDSPGHPSTQTSKIKCLFQELPGLGIRC